MVDWQSPEEQLQDATVFVKFMHSLLGLYAWEFFLSLDFDYDFITGRKKFRWPLIPYFAGRYLLIFTLIGIAVALDTTKEVDCHALYTFNQLAGDAAVGLASINLSLRTMVVWSQNRYVIAGLVIIILGHWSLILQGVLLQAVWVPGTGCVITHANNTILAATFIYSMVFDLIVLLLNAYKLVLTSDVGRRAGSQLGRLIFGDGLIFFIIAFLSNFLATVFMLLNLNSTMNIIFNVPAAVASTIVASRVVRRLNNFTNQGPEVFGSSQASGAGVISRPNITRPGPPKPGVHVQMETFTRAEDPSDQDVEAYQRYDAGDKLQTVHLPPTDDISETEDFKRPSY